MLRPELGGPRDWFFGALLLGALLFVVSQTLGWERLLSPWGTLDWRTLLGAAGLTALSYGLRALRIYDYFQPRLRGRFPAVLRLSVLHNSANNLLPMRAGELVFPWLMKRYFGQRWTQSFQSLLWLRLLDVHFLGLMGLLVLYLRDPRWFWPLLGLGWVGLLISLARGRKIPCAAPRSFWQCLLATLPASPGTFWRVYLWTALSWSLKLLSFVLILGHFLPLASWRLLVGVLGAELSSVLPFHGIAGGGSYELAALVALMPTDISAEAALGGAVNLHLFLLGMTLLLGSLALLLPKRPKDWQPPEN